MRSLLVVCVLMALVALTPAPGVPGFAAADTYTWTPTAAGTYDWNDSTSNWTSGFPNDTDDIADMYIDLLGHQTINLNEAITVGALYFGDSDMTTKFVPTIAAGTSGSLIFRTSSGNAVLSKSSFKSDPGISISAPITLMANLDVINVSSASSGSLTLSGIISESDGSYGLNKLGVGRLNLARANTFTGPLTINNGTVNPGIAIGDIGTAGPLGMGDATSDATNAASLVLNNGTLLAASSTNRLFTLGRNGGTIANSGATFTSTGAIVMSGTGDRTLTFYNDSTSGLNVTFNPLIGDPSSGKTSIRLENAGNNQSVRLTLVNSGNSYAGATTITSGGNKGPEVRVASLADIGSNSSIGKGDSTDAATNAASLVLLGSTVANNPVLLTYTGPAVSTDRLFTLGTGHMRINSSGTGAVNFTNVNPIAFTGSGARTFTLGGANTGNNTLTAILGNGPGGATRLNKSDGGTWILAGQNTYTGDTTINGGTLTLASTGSLLMDIAGFTELLGSGTLNLDGTLKFDVAGVTDLGSWKLVADTLKTTYGSTFSVEIYGGPTFVQSNDVWSHTDTSGTWTFTESTGMLELGVPIPEPGTLALLGMALLGLGWYVWRRSRR